MRGARERQRRENLRGLLHYDESKYLWRERENSRKRVNWREIENI